MERIEALFDKSRVFYQGEDFARVRRITELCEWLAGSEGSDIEILLAAAILYPAHPSEEDAPQIAFEKRKSLGRARALLGESAYLEEEILRVVAVIDEAGHGSSRSIESAILQDAITLDGLGAVGVLRALGGEALVLSSFYEGGDPLGELQAREGHESVFDRLVKKAFRWSPKTRTALAGIEAERRMKFMKIFLEQLRGELFPHGMHAGLPSSAPAADLSGTPASDASL